MDVSNYGSSSPFKWTHERLLNFLVTGKNPILLDPLLINAFRMIDRGQFVPEKYQDLAYYDRNLPLEYDEIMTSPVTLARMLQILGPLPGKKYLNLGTGSGYLAALLGAVAGSTGKVYSLERVQWLWEQARQNIRKYPNIGNVEVLYRDGSEGLLDKHPYDGIVVSFIMPEAKDSLVMQLQTGGKLIYPDQQHILHLIEKVTEDDILEEEIPDFSTYNFGNGKNGVA